jgi:hypothetical protein
LQYADDIFLFIQCGTNQDTRQKRLLYVFEAMFDLKINSLTSELIIAMDANEKVLMSTDMVVFHIEKIGQ